MTCDLDNWHDDLAWLRFTLTVWVKLKFESSCVVRERRMEGYAFCCTDCFAAFTLCILPVHVLGQILIYSLTAVGGLQVVRLIRTNGQRVLTNVRLVRTEAARPAWRRRCAVVTPAATVPHPMNRPRLAHVSTSLSLIIHWYTGCAKKVGCCIAGCSFASYGPT